MKKITLKIDNTRALKLINNLGDYGAELVALEEIQDTSNPVKSSRKKRGRMNTAIGKVDTVAAWREMKDDRIVTASTKWGQTKLDIDKTLANMGLTRETLLRSVARKGTLESSLKTAIRREERCL